MGFSALFKGLSTEESKNIANKEAAAATAASIDRKKKQLESRFGFNAIPFIQANLSTYRLSGLTSILANIASAMLFFYFIFDIFAIIPYWPLQYILTFAVLVAIEKAKRYYSDSMWDNFFVNYYTFKESFWNAIPKVPATINIGIFVLSLAGSLIGGVYVGTDFSPEAAIIKDKIAKVEAEKATHLSNKNSKGEIYWDSQKAIPKLDQKLDKLESELAAAVASGANPNTSASDDASRSQMRVYLIILMACFVELIFEYSMGFRSYYDYRVHLFLNDEDYCSKSIPPIDDIGDDDKWGAPPTSIVEKISDFVKGDEADEYVPSSLAGSEISAATGFGGKSESDYAVYTSVHACTPQELENMPIELRRLIQALKEARTQGGKWLAKIKNNEGVLDTNIQHLDKHRKDELKIINEIQTLSRLSNVTAQA